MNATPLAQVKKVVGKIPLPDFVRDIEYVLDEDHLGHPCVRIRVTIADDDSDLESQVQSCLVLMDSITKAVLEKDIELWPYVSFASESERNASGSPA